MTAPHKPSRGWPRWVRWGLVIATVTLLAAAALFWRATTPRTPPAFYEIPDPLPAGPPGALIRSEPVTRDLPAGAVAWRILYLSTGQHGEPVAVSGLVVAPAGRSASPRPVLAWANGTVGVLPECGISHTARPFQQIPEVARLVAEGFVVVATDYPGLGTAGIHPYLVGPIAAHAVLDSVRAVRRLDVDAGDRFAVWGRSQGGHSALWVGSTAATYAPELHLTGVAASAPAIDLAGILRYGMDKRGGSIVISLALYSWSYVYPEVSLDALIKPGLRDQFERVARTCLTTPLAYLTLGGIPTPAEYLARDPLAEEPYKSIVASNTPADPIPVPLLISHGTGDRLIPFEGSEAEAARRCAAGEDVQFVRYPGVDHDAADESAIMTIGWLEDRFAGRATGPTCGEGG